MHMEYNIFVPDHRGWISPEIRPLLHRSTKYVALRTMEAPTASFHFSAKNITPTYMQCYL